MGFDHFDLRDLSVPVLGAPMAGGPGTPQLAAAVSSAGGLGFLAAGYLTPERLADDLGAARAACSGALGVNLFVPQRSVAVPDELARYRVELAGVARNYGVEVGEPRDDDDFWAEKLELIAEVRPEVVSFTFGAPDAGILTRLRGLGVLTLVTVTSPREARVAVAGGAGGLVVQGPRAGGHRGTFAPDVAPAAQSLPDLLDSIVPTYPVPVVAAGGLATAEDFDAMMRRGACAGQAGTALLLADEAGTNVVHRAALTGGAFTETVVTRSFSGRYARGLLNDFIRHFDDKAPLGYPEVHYMTSPIRRAAVAAGDPQGTNLWAGTEFARAQARPAADIVGELAPVRR